MSKEQYPTNLPAQSNASTTNDASNSSVPPRVGPYRSISAKRPRDPSHRKSVSFNDVPIVYEVPSHDIMRSGNADVYRSWLYTDATAPASVVPSLYSTQTISPLNSASTTAQKLHANRLSSALYATSSTVITPNRMPDWALRTKGLKPATAAEEAHVTNENNPPANGNVPGASTSDEKVNNETAGKNSNSLPYNHPYMIHTAQPVASSMSTTSFSSVTPESNEDKRYSSRGSTIPETEHVRGLSLTNGSLTNTAPTYASVLASNPTPSTYSSNEQLTYPNSRVFRARSAMTPSTATQSSIRTNEPISIAPFRAPTTMTTAFSVNPLTPTARTILRPSTAAFQSSQPTAPAATSTLFSSSSPNLNPMTNSSTTAANSLNVTNLSSTTPLTTTTKPPTAPLRFNPSAAAAAAAHSRNILPQNRTLTSAALSAAAMRYTFAHPTNDSTFAHTIMQQSTPSKPPPTAYPRSRSANVLSMRRASGSHVGLMDGQQHGGAANSGNDPTSSLYGTMLRSPNVRQNYGSYYLQRVLLPTSTN